MVLQLFSDSPDPLESEILRGRGGTNALIRFPKSKPVDLEQIPFTLQRLHLRIDSLSLPLSITLTSYQQSLPADIPPQTKIPTAALADKHLRLVLLYV